MLIKFLLPKKCILCSEYISEESDFCASCFMSFSFANEPWCQICGSRFEYIVHGKMICALCIQRPPHYNVARHLFVFNAASKKTIHRFKFCDDTKYANVYANLLSKKFAKDIEDYEIITPVPMYFLKRLFRMYNQAQLLALYLSKATNKRLEHCLRKTKWTKPQTALTKNERQRNLSSSIILSNEIDVRDRSIILVDDVYTTGATVNLCARELKKAGAKKIMVLTIAKTYRSAL